MANKTVILGMRTKLLYNECKGMMQSRYPQQTLTDEMFVYNLLKLYRGDKIGNARRRKA